MPCYNIKVLYRARSDERLSLLFCRARLVPFQGTSRARNSIIVIVEEFPADRMALPGKIRFRSVVSVARLVERIHGWNIGGPRGIGGREQRNW